MTLDVIDETTVEYIIRDEKYFALALCVEKAMPIVRRRLGEMVLSDVGGRFSNNDWKIFPDYESREAYRPLIVLRKSGWCEFNSADRETGIRLATERKDDFDFAKLYVCLHIHDSYLLYFRKNASDVLDKFKNLEKQYTCSSKDEMHNGIMWEYLERIPDSRWGEDFLERAANPKKREGIVNLLDERINKMADLIDCAMKELRSRT